MLNLIPKPNRLVSNITENCHYSQFHGKLSQKISMYSIYFKEHKYQNSPVFNKAKLCRQTNFLFGRYVYEYFAY